MNNLDIVKSLAGKTYTLGWDAVVAYDREKINHLLQQQYVRKLAAGTHFPPITWETKSKTIRFENVTLGTPLISFENANTENSRASAILEFIDGNVIEKDSNDQVINYTRIRPGMGLAMKLNIDLIAGEGSVDEKGTVLVNFSKGSITQIDLNLTSELPAEVREYFSRWLLDNPVIYELGGLSQEDLNTKFTPKKFIIRTQCAPGAALLSAANYGDGAVLLFVATEYNSDGGALPTNNYPWLIPEENSSAILINNKVVVEYYIKPSLDKVLTNGEWKIKRGSASNNDIYYLEASNEAQINIGAFTIEVNRVVNDIFVYAIWSGTFTTNIGQHVTKVPKEFIYSLKGSSLLLNGETVNIDFNESEKFYSDLSHDFLDQTPHPPQYFAETIAHSFLFKGDIIYEPIIDSEKKSINFKFKQNNVGLTHDMGAINQDPRGLKPIYEEFGDKIYNLLMNNMNVMNNISFDNIGIFGVDKVLFPNQNINRLESAFFPGDLIIFGNIDPALTSLALSPLTSTISVGDKLAFTTNTKDKVTYTLSPKEAGNITPEGVYYAPDSINEGALNVTVTATTEKGSASAHVSVVSTPVLLSPSFVTLQEDNLHTISFNAKILGADRTLDKWTLSSSNPEVVGSIDRNGVYTPPAPDAFEGYPLDYTYITVTATASDGKTSHAYIMLVSNQTHPEFKVLPSFARVSPKVTRKFTAKETMDFVPNTWTYYPERGKLSKPENEDDLYWVNYTAPDKLSGDELTVIRAMQKGKPHRAGYSVIDLSNKTP